MITSFVFVDIQDKPFYCHMWGNDLWLFYWNIDHWVSWRELSKVEAKQLPRNLLSEKQQIYHDQHAQWEKRE